MVQAIRLIKRQTGGDDEGGQGDATAVAAGNGNEIVEMIYERNEGAGDKVGESCRSSCGAGVRGRKIVLERSVFLRVES